MVKKLFNKIFYPEPKKPELSELQKIFYKFHEFTMIPEKVFIDNLQLCLPYKNVPGNIVECGVWRGGMIAAVAEKLGNDCSYFLCDSFEGLPPVQDIDG